VIDLEYFPRRSDPGDSIRVNLKPHFYDNEIHTAVSHPVLFAIFSNAFFYESFPARENH